jgi:hypothetical protein
MRQSLIGCALLVAALLCAGPARAVQPENFTLLKTEDLYRVCAAPDSSPLYAEARQACYGFIYGAGLFYYEAVKAGKAKRAVCPQEPVTRETVRVAFVDWVSAHPDALPASPIDSLLRATMAKWPCPDQPS